jgi:DNA-binding NarL/FixJ family response regulator
MSGSDVDPRAGSDALTRARAAGDRLAWSEAFAQFAAADAGDLLDATDLERFAACAHMLGRLADRDALCVRAHQRFIERNDAESAARCAFWLGMELTTGGQPARGGGWIARAQRLIDDAGVDSVVSGYLLMPQAIRRNAEGKAAEAHELFERAVAIARRFNDNSLLAVARNGVGRALIRLGRISEGVALLDEVMVAVTSGDVSPILMGTVYCSVTDACHEIFDMRRAQEWTDALRRWCEAQPDMAAFRGVCLVHRAELMQLHGDWSRAMDEARRACEWLRDPPGQPAAGGAFYRAAELHRVRGELDMAETAYAQASERGRQPHPGLALAWMARGRTDAAMAAIRPLLAEQRDTRTRVHVLEAGVEIALAASDVRTARAAAEELAAIAASLGAPYLSAAGAHAVGAVLLAEGDLPAALRSLGEASGAWRALGARFEDARTSMLLALVHRGLGDSETAALELDRARRAFERLGAAPDAARAATLARSASPASANSVTKRETDVLRLLASGKTNRAIASSLGISEKTVARHVSNIFTKLGLANRAAATAYAYEHKLVSRTST